MAAMETDTLTPFESYMLADDTPEYPMTFFLRCRFRGTVEESGFKVALARATADHPLLRATVEKPRSSRPQWLVHDDQQPLLLSHSLGAPLALGTFPHIDLARKSGLRVWFATEDEQTEIWFQFHHACCDALAAIDFLREVFQQYNGRGEERCPDGSAAATKDRIRERRTCAHTGRTSCMALLRSISRTWKFFRNRPQSLPTGLEPHAGDHRFPASLVRPLGCVSRKSFLGGSQEAMRTTVNDWLLASLFSGIAQWCRSQGFDPGDCLRIAVPINLRSDVTRRPTCANVVSMVFLDRTLRKIASAPQMLTGVAAEMSSIKEHRAGQAMLRALAVLSAWPGGLRRVLELLECPTTTVLSNLGVIFKNMDTVNTFQQVCLNGAVLESVDFLPPLRRGTIAAFGTLTYANQLSCCMHYDPRLLTDAAARQLFDGIFRQLHLTDRRNPERLPCG